MWDWLSMTAMPTLLTNFEKSHGLTADKCGGEFRVGPATPPEKKLD
jgi:hypothetical protein